MHSSFGQSYGPSNLEKNAKNGKNLKFFFFCLSDTFNNFYD
jgi:hypothetical protein